MGKKKESEIQLMDRKIDIIKEKIEESDKIINKYKAEAV